jgi:DNA-binding NarL/FixJ family response regulator
VTVLKGLAAIIGRQPDMIVVAQAADGREALDLWREHRPAITVLDSPPWVSSVVEAITVASRRGLVQV